MKLVVGSDTPQRNQSSVRAARLQTSKRSEGMASQILSIIIGVSLGPPPTVRHLPYPSRLRMRNPAVSIVSAQCTDPGRSPYGRGRRWLQWRVTATQRHGDLHALHTLHNVHYTRGPSPQGARVARVLQDTATSSDRRPSLGLLAPDRLGPVIPPLTLTVKHGS